MARLAVSCGGVAGISCGVVGGTPMGSAPGPGTCSGNGEGIPGGTSCCGVSGGVGVRAGPGLGFAGVGCGLLGSTCGCVFGMAERPRAALIYDVNDTGSGGKAATNHEFLRAPENARLRRMARLCRA